MDARLRAEIVAEVRKAMTTFQEKWVTADVLCEYVGTLTKRFLQDHGQMFNRTRMEWDEKDKDGKIRHVVSREWLYPLHEIQDMIATGKIKELKMN